LKTLSPLKDNMFVAVGSKYNNNNNNNKNNNNNNTEFIKAP